MLLIALVLVSMVVAWVVATLVAVGLCASAAEGDRALADAAAPVASRREPAQRLPVKPLRIA